MVTYPGRPSQRPNITRPNINLTRPATVNIAKPTWDNRRWGGNRGVWGNIVNITINNNFSYNYNFSYRPVYWGARPWWAAGHCHTWHHGHWSYGWNTSYYRRRWYYNDADFAAGFMWGIAVWSLGNLIYDMGYYTYSNPYPTTVVKNTYITYTQPISVVAAANPPGDEEATALAESRSNEALERSRAAFKMNDYIRAAEFVDDAIAYTPSDVTLHEYRALVFFALGKFADAAGILNPVLASGPGWSWETMIGFYGNPTIYTDQLRRLEDYTRAAPENAAAHFLLGYHYMVSAYMEAANQAFATAAAIQPADSISRQLRDLTASSIPDAEEADVEPIEQPATLQTENLVGSWISDRGPDGTVTFTMTTDGDYTWTFVKGDTRKELNGTYSLNEQGLLVLASDDTQMISEIEFIDDRSIHFTLVGAPEGDTGLDFTRI